MARTFAGSSRAAAKIRLHPFDLAARAHVLALPMDINTPVARVTQHRPDRRWRPRHATPAANCRRWYAFLVQPTREPLQPAPDHVVLVDSADHLGLSRVDGRDGLWTPVLVLLAYQLVPVALAASNPARTNTGAQGFARPRSDGFEFHLMPGALDALDEGGHLVDRVLEQNLLPGRVIEQAASTVADKLSDDQRHLERIATEPRLIAAHDDIAGLDVGEQSPDTIARVEVIASLAVVDVLDRPVRLAELAGFDEGAATVALYIKAELLLALVVLRSP